MESGDNNLQIYFVWPNILLRCILIIFSLGGWGACSLGPLPTCLKSIICTTWLCIGHIYKPILLAIITQAWTL